MLFDRAEYQTRLEKTKARMEQAGVELLVVADPANMNYLTGYDGWSFYVPQVVVVAGDADEPIWIGREMDTNGARHTTFLASQNIVSYPEDFVQQPSKHPMSVVGDEIRRRGWDRRAVGVESDAYAYSARADTELRRALPKAVFKDADLLVNWVRIVKSEAEIELMRQAGAIVERVMTAALEVVRPGVRECDAVAEISRAQIRGSEEFGGDYPAIVPLAPSGEKTSTPHLTWADETYHRDEAVNLELAGCRHRYHSALARTVYLGANPPRRLAETADVVVEGLERSLEAVRPGVRCEEVEDVWRGVISRAGLSKPSRIGYTIGIGYPPDWGEHTASLRPGDRTELVPNMTFHMMLGMWMDNWGFECSETFCVTDIGCETFSKFPRKLFLIDR